MGRLWKQGLKQSALYLNKLARCIELVLAFLIMNRRNGRKVSITHWLSHQCNVFSLLLLQWHNFNNRVTSFFSQFSHLWIVCRNNGYYEVGVRRQYLWQPIQSLRRRKQNKMITLVLTGIITTLVVISVLLDCLSDGLLCWFGLVGGWEGGMVDQLVTQLVCWLLF